jgi:hypothetical protein
MHPIIQKTFGVLSPHHIRRFLVGLVATPLALVAGCAELEQLSNSVQNTTDSFLTVTDTLPTICKATDNNREMAIKRYGSKGFTTTGELDEVSEGNYLGGRYQALLSAGPVRIFSYTYNGERVTHLKNGRMTQVSGIIEDLFYSPSTGCRITLRNATFQQD